MLRTFARPATILAVAGLLFGATGPSLVRHPATRLAERGDSLLNAWIMAWDAHALTTPGRSVWDAPVFDPAPNALGFSETMFGTLWYALPINYLTGNPVLAANAHIVLAFVLCMYSTYLLVRGLTDSSAAGVVAGAMFSYNPIRWGQLAHMNLLAFYLAPVALLNWHRFLASGRRRPFFAAVALLAGQYYLSINLGTVALTTAIVYTLAHCLLARRGRDRLFLLRRWRLLAAGVAEVTVTLAGPGGAQGAPRRAAAVPVGRRVGGRDGRVGRRPAPAGHAGPHRGAGVRDLRIRLGRAGRTNHRDTEAQRRPKNRSPVFSGPLCRCGCSFGTRFAAPPAPQTGRPS